MTVDIYMNNPNLKGKGVEIEFEPWQIEEWIKCKTDPIHFIENYIKVVTLDHGLQPMKMYNFQKSITKAILIDSNRLISNCARQMGKSTIMAAIFCHYIIFNDNKTCAILANKATVSREILSRVKLAYEHLPKWLQHGVVEWNKGTIELENGSKVMASATSSSAIRGFSVNFLFIDEFAHIPSNIAEEFFTSVYPTISSGANSKLALVSTPNGMNLFYKYWIEATAGNNGFTAIKAIWSDIPTRDAKWAKEQKSILGEIKFAQENEGEFIGASNTLISGAKLKSIAVNKPIAVSESMRFYAKPQKDHHYVITVDTSRGTGNDYSAFTVVDVTSLPYNVVAIYADNLVSPMIYPSLIYKIANEYNKAWVIVETNDIGEAVANQLYFDFEYEEIVLTTKEGVISSFSGKIPGLRTTRRVKSMGCTAMKTLIENDQLIINDYDILYELSNFVLKGSSYEADSGHDDLVMCLVIFSYLTTQQFMEEITSDSAKAKILQMKQQQTEDSMIPVGFFDDGLDQEPTFVF